MIVTVKNSSSNPVSEVFPALGRVEVKVGETKSIPAEVAAVWLDPLRQKVCIEVVAELEAEPEAEPEVVVTPDPEAPLITTPELPAEPVVEDIPELELSISAEEPVIEQKPGNNKKKPSVVSIK